MTSSTSAGTMIAMTSAVPTSQDAGGYGALAFTTIGGVESIPAFGAQVAVNSYQPLAGPQEKHKGPVNYGSLQIPMALDKADVGQILLRIAAAPSNNATYAFQVTFPNGDKRYFQGRVFGAQETPGSATNVLMLTSTIEINTAVVKVDADTPAPAPTLGTLTLSGPLQIGTATSGTITGATPGSTIASNIPGITVNSGARTYSGTPTGSAQTIANGLVETLAGATGSPNPSSVTVAATGASGLVIDWRTPLTAITDLAGASDTAMLAQQQAATSKGRSASFAIASGATGGRIIDIPASSRPIMASWVGAASTTTAVVETSTDGGTTWTDAGFAPTTPSSGQSPADRRQRHMFAAGSARKARITITAGTIGVTIKMLIHTMPASGIADTTIIIGASREDLLTSESFENAVIAEQSDRDPIIWNWGVSAAQVGPLANTMAKLQTLFGNGGIGSAYIGSAVGNNVSDSRIYTSAQKAALDTGLNTVIDTAIAVTGAAERVVMANTSYRNYTTTGTSTQGPATPPNSQAGGSLEYNLNVVDPRIAARLPHAYDATQLRSREDEYLWQLGDYRNLGDEVHYGSTGIAKARTFHAQSAFRYFRYATWPTSQLEQRVATVEASSLQADYDAAVNALSAIDPAASAKAGLQSRVTATNPAVKTKSADLAVTVAEGSRTQGDKDTAQTAITAAVAVQNGTTTPQNAALQTRLNAVSTVTIYQKIGVNFGETTARSGFNSYSDLTQGFALALNNQADAASGITITNTTSWQAVSAANGLTEDAVTDAGTIPSAVNRAYFSKSAASPGGTVTLSGLNSARKYDIYATFGRTGSTEYIQNVAINGQAIGGDFSALSPVKIKQLKDITGVSSIPIQVQRGAGNATFFYINALLIVEHS